MNLYCSNCRTARDHNINNYGGTCCICGKSNGRTLKSIINNNKMETIEQQVKQALNKIPKSKQKEFIEKGLKINMFKEEHKEYYIKELKEL